MPAQAHPNDIKKPIPARLPFYYGWVNLLMAALAMVATLPGRSVGIGLITEPLIADLGLTRLSFGEMNFLATLLGASFNLLCGPAIDRFGARSVVAVILAALGFILLAFSNVVTASMLLLLLILTRGLGQSALSVVSLTIVGKWFVRRLSIAMGIFSVIISIAFGAAILFTQSQVLSLGWRATWAGLGWVLLGAAVVAFLLVRPSPESIGLDADTEKNSEKSKSQESASVGFTLKGAFKTPAFWVFAIGSGFYNLVIAGVLLFNQSILQQLGFGETVFRYAMAMFMITGLGGNILAGWLARKWSLGKLMSIAMLLVVVYLLLFPFLRTVAQTLCHAGLLGFAGGVVAVIFFTAWGKVFGRLHLGKIQGSAQVFTVFASAIGPWFLAYVFDKTGSYAPAFYTLAPAIAVVAIAGWFVRIPVPKDFKLK